MKRILAVAFALLLVLALTGCQHAPSSGTVTAMHYDPAHTDLIPVTHCSGGKVTTCYTTIVPIFYPDSYELCLRGDHPDSDGHVRHGCIDVDGRTWHQYRVGDHFPVGR